MRPFHGRAGAGAVACVGYGRQRARELWILRPDGMLGPHLGGGRTGHLVAVAQRIATGRGVHAEVGMRVDDARRDEFSRAVHDLRVRWNRNVGADRGDLPIAQHDRAVLDRRPGRGQDGCVSDGDGPRRNGAVGTGEWISVRCGNSAGTGRSRRRGVLPRRRR